MKCKIDIEYVDEFISSLQSFLESKGYKVALYLDKDDPNIFGAIACKGSSGVVLGNSLSLPILQSKITESGGAIVLQDEDNDTDKDTDKDKVEEDDTIIIKAEC